MTKPSTIIPTTAYPVIEYKGYQISISELKGDICTFFGYEIVHIGSLREEEKGMYEAHRDIEWFSASPIANYPLCYDTILIEAQSAIDKKGQHLTLSQMPIHETHTVQFCPCGDVMGVSTQLLLEMGGAKQFERCFIGDKLDAPIFSSADCPNCICEIMEREREMAYWCGM